MKMEILEETKIMIEHSNFQMMNFGSQMTSCFLRLSASTELYFIHISSL